MEGLSNIDVSEFIRLAPIGSDWLRLAPTGSDWLRGNGTGSAAGNLPSTRAGGQDDVSLNKLPQIMVIKSYNVVPVKRYMIYKMSNP